MWKGNKTTHSLPRVTEANTASYNCILCDFVLENGIIERRAKEEAKIWSAVTSAALLNNVAVEIFWTFYRIQGESRKSGLSQTT